MARLTRLRALGLVHYVIQEGIDDIFRSDADYLYFLSLLSTYARHYHVQIHGFTLLPTQFHLLLTPTVEAGLTELLKRSGRYYVGYFNRTHQRKGRLWSGRYRAGVIQTSYFLPTLRYIESLPISTHLCTSAKDYSWSSYRRHSGEISTASDAWLHPHPNYLLLANQPFERERAYSDFFQASQSDKEQNQNIYRAAYYNWVYGDAAFTAELARQEGRRLTPGKPGRPLKISKSLSPSTASIKSV